MVQRAACGDREAGVIESNQALDDKEWEQAKLRLAYAAETRRFEIERLWQRSLFFWTVLGAAFVAYGVMEGKSPRASLVISCFGIVAALAWSLQNRGAKYWQEAWGRKTNAHQRIVLGLDLFRAKEPVDNKGWFGAARYSVSRLAIILSDFTVVIWLLLVVRSLGQSLPIDELRGWPCTLEAARVITRWSPLAVVTLAFAWCLLLLIFGRSERE